MLIEFIGGRMDGESLDINVGGNAIKIPYRCSGQVCAYSMMPDLVPKVIYLLYRRKPSTNKFYFDKIEEE